MPCVDGGPVWSEKDELRARLDKVTRLLCEVLTRVPGAARLTHELAEWWTIHQEDDARRKVQEEEEQIRQREADEKRARDLLREAEDLRRKWR